MSIGLEGLIGAVTPPSTSNVDSNSSLTSLAELFTDYAQSELDTESAVDNMNTAIGDTRDDITDMFARLDENIATQRSHTQILINSGSSNADILLDNLQQNIDEAENLRGTYTQLLNSMTYYAGEVGNIADPATQKTAAENMLAEINSVRSDVNRSQLGLAQNELRQEAAGALQVMDKFDNWITQKIENISAQTPEGGTMSSSQIQEILDLQYLQSSIGEFKNQLANVDQFFAPYEQTQNYSPEQVETRIAELDAISANLSSINNL